MLSSIHVQCPQPLPIVMNNIQWVMFLVFKYLIIEMHHVITQLIITEKGILYIFPKVLIEHSARRV